MVHSPLFFFARGAAVLFLQAAFAFREVHSTRRENINNPGAVPEGKAVDGRSPLDAHQCSFVRTMPPTNGTDHRILSVPREVWINAKEPHASLFARKLCCVYTHLQKDNTYDVPKLTAYDGREFRYTTSHDSGGNRGPTSTPKTFVEIAAKAFSDVCSTHTGQHDCKTIGDRCSGEHNPIMAARVQDGESSEHYEQSGSEFLEQPGSQLRGAGSQ